jgi:hypothetical protein
MPAVHRSLLNKGQPVGLGERNGGKMQFLIKQSTRISGVMDLAKFEA